MDHNDPSRISRLVQSNYHYTHYSLEYFLNKQEELGIENIELYLRAPHVWIDSENINKPEDVKQQTMRHGLNIPCVRPEFDSRTFMISSLDTERCEKSRKYYRNCVRFASAIGAKMILVNALGAFFDERYDAVFGCTAKFLKSLCEFAGERNIQVSLESSCQKDSMIANSLTELKKLVDAVSHPALAVTLDTVSMANGDESIRQWFDLLGSRIAYVSLADGRTSSGRYVWGEGALSLESCIAALNREGYKGLLGLRLSLEEYLNKPDEADARNIQKLLGTLPLRSTWGQS